MLVICNYDFSKGYKFTSMDFIMFLGVSKKPTRVFSTVDFESDVCLIVRPREKSIYALLQGRKSICGVKMNMVI